jgi:tRNA-specific 2-thiouridylase
MKVAVKLRSAQSPAVATLYSREDDAEVVLGTPQAGVAPGQACVFYDGERMLGGGWIVHEESAAVAA